LESERQKEKTNISPMTGGNQKNNRNKIGKKTVINKEYRSQWGPVTMGDQLK